MRVFISSFHWCTESGTSQCFSFEKLKREGDQVGPTSAQTKHLSLTLRKKLTFLQCKFFTWICQSGMRATRVTATITACCLMVKQAITEEQEAQLFSGSEESSSDGEGDGDENFLGTFGQHFFIRLHEV